MNRFRISKKTNFEKKHEKSFGNEKKPYVCNAKVKQEGGESVRFALQSGHFLCPNAATDMAVCQPRDTVVMACQSSCMTLAAGSGAPLFSCHMLKIQDMQNEQRTAGETAQRTLVIFRDCHSKNNIVIPIVCDYEERFYRHFAHRMGWLCTIRKPVAHTELTKATVWRKPVAIAARPRPQLGGTFNLALTEIRKGGVA